MRINDIIITDAISSPLGRDEYIDHKIEYFEKSPTVYKINDLELRKYLSSDSTELYYGLVNPINNELAGIFQLENIGKFWQVRLSQMQQLYKSQGYGSFMYDYAVMNDGLTIISDFSQTEGSLGGSKGLWQKLYRQGRFTVCGYNLETGETIPIRNMLDIETRIYNQQDNIVWMATPKPQRESISEMLDRINQRNVHRTIQWYGEGIVDN